MKTLTMLCGLSFGVVFTLQLVLVLLLDFTRDDKVIIWLTLLGNILWIACLFFGMKYSEEE